MYYYSMFYFEKLKGKTVLKSDLLNDLTHYFTTRESVIKTQEADFEKLVADNKKMFCDSLSIKASNLISPTQTHSTNIEIAQIGESHYPECDALILNNSEQGVFLNFADCTPIILFDKANKIAAIAHAGWRGTAGKIAAKTVDKMVNDFGTKPENILAAIGPTISACCYNVKEDVLIQLLETVEDKTELTKSRNDEQFVDLKLINKRQLEEIGVKEIDVCNYCTVCDNEMFFSYRKENATTNRHSAIIFLGK